ncbi:hypothetical protein Goshw_001737 [Gossypium schwendimanii]|uniref:DUF4283 domain-containing protein n=1 Tax=Gossypium schwendimanii TaxID=34291 RepID=A0A7J9NC63_GOSSC|nr:hypothetical protein [Gossypium schwendimanii]
MMDIENGYFLVKFQNKLDCEKALSEGHWIIFGQYLMVQPWTLAFDPTQAYPSVVMAWIRFPGLPGYLYNHKIITEIGETIGKVVKLYMNTDSRTRGQFGRLAVYVDLKKPLLSHILMNGRKRNVEYESLPTIFFAVGDMGMWRILVLLKFSKAIVKRRMPRWKCHRRIRPRSRQQIEKEGSRFRVLNDKDTYKEDVEGFLLDSRRYKGKETSQGNFMGKASATFLNGRKNINSNLKEVGLMEKGAPIFKRNSRPNSEPNKPSSSLKENFLNLKKPVSSLGNGGLPAADEMQTTLGDGMGFRLEEESSQNEKVVEDSGRDNIAVSLDVGNLDSGRHSAVVFHKNLQIKENNIAHSTKNFDSSQMLSSGSSKAFKNKGRGQAKKQSKLLHGSNSHFKISGAQRNPLKESMEHIAESISTFATPNLGVVTSIETIAQIEGDKAPGQICGLMDLFSLGKEAVLSPDLIGP